MKNSLIVVAVVIIVAVGAYLVGTNSSNPVGQAPSTLADQNSSTAVSQETNSNTQPTNSVKTFVKSGASTAVNTTPAAQSKTLSNTDMCRKYAQEVAYWNGESSKNLRQDVPWRYMYYSVQSDHYSTIDNACYYEIHYQMETNSQGSIYVSQNYELKAVSDDTMKDFYSGNLGSMPSDATEANCIVPNTNYSGLTTQCKYFGLDWKTFSSANHKIIGQIHGNSDGVPLSYPDYQALLQKRMSN